MTRSLLVRDASGYVDALTGEGMRIGSEEGRAAVNAILAGGLHWASSQRTIRPLIVSTAIAFPRVFRQIVNTLGLIPCNPDIVHSII